MWLCCQPSIKMSVSEHIECGLMLLIQAFMTFMNWQYRRIAFSLRLHGIFVSFSCRFNFPRVSPLSVDIDIFCNFLTRKAKKNYTIKIWLWCKSIVLKYTLEISQCCKRASWKKSTNQLSRFLESTFVSNLLSRAKKKNVETVFFFLHNSSMLSVHSERHFPFQLFFFIV
jgi:hypothetical protein